MRSTTVDRDVAEACLEIGSELGSVDPAALPTETSPEAIARDQREAVMGAVYELFGRARPRRSGADLAAAVSDHIHLCPWVCHRRLFELGLAPEPEKAPDAARKRRQFAARLKAISAYLVTQRRYVLAHEIAAATGLTPYEVRAVTSWSPSPLKRIVSREADVRGGAVYAYQVPGFAGPVDGSAESA